MNVAAYAAAVVLFVLAGLGVHLGSVGELDLIAFGSAAFAAGHLLPR